MRTLKCDHTVLDLGQKGTVAPDIATVAGKHQGRLLIAGIVCAHVVLELGIFGDRHVNAKHAADTVPKFTVSDLDLQLIHYFALPLI